MEIFVVDDSAMVRHRITAMLSEIPNINVIAEAEDAPEAIHDIALHWPDVIVLDIELRSSNGLDVLRYVVREHPATKVIMLSNQSEPESRELFMNAGAYRFFDKSLEFDKVRDAVRMLATGEQSRPS